MALKVTLMILSCLIGFSVGDIKMSCEHSGSDVALSCPRGFSLKIGEASYGRTESNVCPGVNQDVTDCVTDGATDIVKKLCEGAAECSVSPSNDVFGDPCFGVTKYLTIDYGCEAGGTRRSCEHSGSDAVLTCPAGAALEIYEASYGRTEEDVCPGNNQDVTDCITDDALYKVKHLCDGLNECSMFPSNDVFGDPCPDVRKYLTIKYGCQSESGTTEQPSVQVSGTFCKGNRASFKCKGATLNILTATYGRSDTTTCPGRKDSQNENTDCSLDVTDALKDLCKDKDVCRFKVNDRKLGKPCPGTALYLTYTYECL